MKVKELMEELAKCDPESELIMQADAEGNGYSPLCGADPDVVYVPRNSWSGEAYDTNDSAENNGLEDHEWNELLKGPRCVVLHPVN